MRSQARRMSFRARRVHRTGDAQGPAGRRGQRRVAAPTVVGAYLGDMRGCKCQFIGSLRPAPALVTIAARPRKRWTSSVDMHVLRTGRGAQVRQLRPDLQRQEA